jgi:hypothetical protein
MNRYDRENLQAIEKRKADRPRARHARERNPDYFGFEKHEKHEKHEKQRNSGVGTGPGFSANVFPVGTCRLGVDGHLYIVTVTKNGIKKWKLDRKGECMGTPEASIYMNQNTCCIVTGEMYAAIDDVLRSDNIPPYRREPTQVPYGVKNLIFTALKNNYFTFGRILSYISLTETHDLFLGLIKKDMIIDYPVKLLTWKARTDEQNRIRIKFVWKVLGNPPAFLLTVPQFKDQLIQRALRANTGWSEEMMTKARFGPLMVPEIVEKKEEPPRSAPSSSSPHVSPSRTSPSRTRTYPTTSSSSLAVEEGSALVVTKAPKVIYRPARSREDVYYVKVNDRYRRKKLTHGTNGRYAFLLTLVNSKFEVETVEPKPNE